MSKVLLIVDDEPFIRTFLKAKAGRMFPDVLIKEAADGEQAMEIIKSDHIDLVTIDINMPFINGVELISSMKQQSEYAQLPIIVVSANVSNTVKESLTRLGVTEIFGKLEVTTSQEIINTFDELIKQYLSS